MSALSGANERFDSPLNRWTAKNWANVGATAQRPPNRRRMRAQSTEKKRPRAFTGRAGATGGVTGGVTGGAELGAAAAAEAADSFGAGADAACGAGSSAVSRLDLMQSAIWLTSRLDTSSM